MIEPPNSNRRGGVPAVTILLVLAAPVVLGRGALNLRDYIGLLRQTQSAASIAAGAAALVVALSLFFLGIRTRPRQTAALLGVAAAILLVTSGNIRAFLVASGLLALTLLVGDGVSRLFLGRNPEKGAIAISIAAGSITIGGVLLLLGEAGLARPLPLAACASALFVLRARRIAPIMRDLRATALELSAGPYPAAQAAWLSIVVGALGVAFLGVLRPDVFYDALAYHLPEVRDFALQGRVRPLPNVFGTTLWHNHETFLGAAFLAGGERAVRLTQFGVGLAAFASAATLARRLRGKGTGPLVLFAMAAVPAVCAQLKETVVDLPAALCLIAATAEVAGSSRENRRSNLGGFLFGGAIVTKVFALWGSVALLVLLLRRRRSPRALLAFAFWAAIPLLPWLAWSQSRFGFFLSPYSDPVIHVQSPQLGPTGAPERPWTRNPSTRIAAFLRLAYYRTFRLVFFGREGDGVVGLVPLILLLGLFGWDRRRLALFAAAALSALVPWYVLSVAKLLAGSIRFLIPIYPLYAVFTALGLAKSTEGFRGRAGTAAAFWLSVLAIGFPAQFFSTLVDAKIALRRISVEQGLSLSLPAYPLWKLVHPEDRVLLLGEWDRYHCPAGFVIRDLDLSDGGNNPSSWWSEIRRLGITKIVYRSDVRRVRRALAPFSGCLELIGRSGTASLFRVLENPECPAPDTSAALEPLYQIWYNPQCRHEPTQAAGSPASMSDLGRTIAVSFSP